jgi:hypothetical protein
MSEDLPLRVSLTRHRIRDGESDTATEWMTMLRERRDECVASLSRDGLALEVIFRAREPDADILYWFEIAAPSAIEKAEDVPESERTDLDLAHLHFAHRAKVPGHTDAEPQLVLMPEPVLAAIRACLG